ncbi:MAG: sulfurase [Patescibacteria group bacterium]|nr:sulfurase [Patescibacteria group bacterium]
MSPPAITLLETRLGQPRPIGVHRSGPKKGQPFWSSIDRQPTGAGELYLTFTGLAGDQPTETRPKTAKETEGGNPGQIHGGNDKAVYVYPWGLHLPHWLDELGEEGLENRSLGENLRVAGASEADVRIGDRWEWGEALVEVSKVRTPCETLETYYGGGRYRMIKRMAANGLCGWYLRVLRDGVVPTQGPIMVVHRALEAPTVAQAFAVKMGRPLLA